MKKVIATTTIYPPSEAVLKFEAIQDWDLVVVGDKKTPCDYRLKRGIFVSADDQEKYDRALSDAIGWNCIQRRNFGFLWAKDMGAEIVAVVDDDNIPLPGWGENLLVGKAVEVDYHETDLPVFDPVGATNYPHLWHRGFPLQLLSKRDYKQEDPPQSPRGHPGGFLERRPRRRRTMPYHARTGVHLRSELLSHRQQQAGTV
jgi:hypothetical protein